jgi:hypothetical protein
MLPNTDVRPGNHVRCELTGIEGLVSSLAVEENGNIRIGIQPKTTDNKLIESFFGDLASITVLDEGIASKGSPLADIEFSIGQNVRDRYSDYTGVITMLIWYLNGCVHALVLSPQLERGKPVTIALPSTRLIAVGLAPEAPTTPPTGGPITMAYARR